jgi:release factor glutamine methyltransferase
MSFQRKRVFLGDFVFVVPEQVYEPAEDTFLLARNLSIEKNSAVLDMGTGCGILAVLAAERASCVVAVDINPHAVACAQRNAELNGVAPKIETREGDLFEPIAPKEMYDLITFNAPYLPVGLDEGESWVEKAWCGGKDGRSVIDRFTNESSKHLTRNGRILLVQSSLSNVERTLTLFAEKKLSTTVIESEKVAFEEIVLIQAGADSSLDHAEEELTR